MREWELPFQEEADQAKITLDFERACSSLGLTINRLVLKKYPGCTHWHLTLPPNKGTLEATLLPSSKRFWLSVHTNRSADWQDDVIKLLVGS